MMKLTTLSNKTSNNSARVYWFAGMNNNGVLDVNIDFEHEEADLIAELIAIQHLIVEREIFDRQPMSGEGYQLKVSKGAIRKLALGRSNKRFAAPFSGLLTGVMRGVDIVVTQRKDFIDLVDKESVEILNATTAEYSWFNDVAQTPAMGDVVITEHALEQYAKRFTDGDVKKPRSSLFRRLRHPELRLLPLEERVLKHKERRYGRADDVEVWGHESSSFKFLVLRNRTNQKRTLVTVFNRMD